MWDTNSPRQMFQLYQDAMTAKCGNAVMPDLFALLLHVIRFGMTSGSNLLPNQKVTDRPIFSCKGIQT